MADKKNIIGFKRFSDIKSKKLEEVNPNSDIKPEFNLPMNPNIPKDSKKIENTASTKEIKPEVNLEEDTNESKVEKIGKLAKFPKNVKASKAYNFLENVKVSKKSIWYIMVEKDNELQMVKYNYKEGVDLGKFVKELKSYYISNNKENKVVCESINKIEIGGNDKYSYIKNIPPLEIGGKKIITRITEDLIKLLSK
jgi:hypothetical protein